LLRVTTKVRERPLFSLPLVVSELELQARWFAGDFGKSFVSTAGEPIEVVQFGTWNREAGPDFCNAAIRINCREILCGSIEFDLADRNWESHGHATNPAFDQTVLHVFVESARSEFFTRTSDNRQVTQIRLDPNSLPSTIAANVPLARPGRCQAPLSDLPEEKIRSILQAAAQFRFQRKTQHLQQLAELHGDDEALFQEIAGALGYKQNKLPFALLAQRLPLHHLRSRRNGIESLLFGLAGFLREPDLAEFAPRTRQYLRALWDDWWPQRATYQRLVLPRSAWHLNGSRPLNHPQRRLAALAEIAAHWSRFRRSLGKNNLIPVRKFFLELRHAYWNFHYSLASGPSRRQIALIGETRITEILANVILPWRECHGQPAWDDYNALPARLTNRRIEIGALRLFGNDPRRPQFLRYLGQHQGLLQIYEDFCLQDVSDCAQCPFPEQMQKWM
jgi:hypothetical protein